VDEGVARPPCPASRTTLGPPRGRLELESAPPAAGAAPRPQKTTLMTPFPGPIRSFIAELRRRRVFRVAVLYAAVSWATIEAANTILPRLALPEWAVTLVVVARAARLPAGARAGVGV
jgi:hypothetical protein